MLPEQVKDIRAFLIDERPIARGGPIPVWEHERAIAAGRSHVFIPDPRAFDVPTIGLWSEPVLVVRGGHERRETFVQPEVRPVPAGHEIPPPLVGKFVRDERDVSRIVQNSTSVGF